MNLTDGQKQKAATHVSWWLTEEGKEVKREKRKKKEREKRERSQHPVVTKFGLELSLGKKKLAKTGLRGCFRLEQVE